MTVCYCCPTEISYSRAFKDGPMLCTVCRTDPHKLRRVQVITNILIEYNEETKNLVVETKDFYSRPRVWQQSEAGMETLKSIEHTKKRLGKYEEDLKRFNEEH